MKDRYAQVYAQIERETERYLHENTLCDGDIDRYGFGKNILRLLMSGLAMHAMGSITGGSKSGGMPISGDFEKLHPRGQSQNAGQFAEKPGKALGAAKPSLVNMAPKAQEPQKDDPAEIDQENNDRDAKLYGEGRRGLQQRLLNRQGKKAASRQTQNLDPITAAVAEKWHGDGQKTIDFDKPAPQPPERTIDPTDDDLTAMKEDPYNYDPEQGAEPKAQTQEAAPAPPQAEAPRMTRMFTKKNWSAGMNQGSIGFQDEEHAAMHELGSKLRNQLSGHNSLRAGAKRAPNMERANKLAAEYAQKHGVDPAEIQTHASAVYRNDKAAMKGIADGEHRDVTYSGFKKTESQEQPQPQPQTEAPPTQPQPDEDVRAQQQAEARAKRNAEHAAKVAAEKAPKPNKAEQKAAEKRVEFDPSEWENEPEDEPAPIAKVKTKDYTKKDSTGKVVEQDLVARDEARAKRANAVRSARRKLNSTAEERGEQNIAEMSENHGLHHDSFSQHVKAMESHEGGLWDAKEKAKTQIRKAWGVTSRDLEKLADKDHTSLEAQDNLSGNVENIHEHLGSDPHYWGQNAWDMLREDTPERPGVHNKEWLEHHAKQFKEMSNNQPQYDNHQDYEEPPDGAPFSRKALTAEIDRYFNEARIQYRKQRQTAASAIWTDKDRWL